MKIVQLRKRHIRTLKELCRMAGKNFSGEIVEDAGALQEHLEKQLSEDGPHEDIKEIKEILQAAARRWNAWTDKKEMKETVERMAGGLAEVLGVDS